MPPSDIHPAAAHARPARRPGAVDRFGGPGALASGAGGHALEAAYHTLVRGAFFTSRQVRGGGRGAPGRDDDLLYDRTAVRLLGNRLCELDRFLGTVAEEAALHLRLPGHDARAFSRLRNSANKLREVWRMMALDSPDHEPLRAVGRVRDCLHHCGGRVHGAAGQRQLAPAIRMLGMRGTARPAGGVARLALSPRAIKLICRLYRRSAADLIGEVHRRRPLAVDFSGNVDHIRVANVACDGI